MSHGWPSGRSWWRLSCIVSGRRQQWPRMTKHSKQTTDRGKLLKSCHENCFLEEMKALAAARDAQFIAWHKQEWLTMRKNRGILSRFYISSISIYTQHTTMLKWKWLTLHKHHRTAQTHWNNEQSLMHSQRRHCLPLLTHRKSLLHDTSEWLGLTDSTTTDWFDR